MAEPEVEIKFTYQDYLQMPGDKRYELIGGELYMVPSPDFAHQRILRDLGFLLWEFVKEHNLGVVLYAPFDVVLSEEDVVQPDILFVSKSRSEIITEKNIHGAPDLVIEILSETTAEWDRTIKKKLYAKYGVREYWLVDPKAKSIEVMVLGKRGFETMQVYPQGTSLISPLLPGLAISIKEIF